MKQTLWDYRQPHSPGGLYLKETAQHPRGLISPKPEDDLSIEVKTKAQMTSSA